MLLDEIAGIMKKGFKAKQAIQIHIGIEAGLTSEQIANYADPKFSAWEMHLIREGLEVAKS